MTLPLVQPPTYSDYLTHSRIWKPQAEGDQSLFLVRIPTHLRQIGETLYEQLMMLRVQWMIRTWIDRSGESQQQTARRLAQALSILSTQQMPPPLHWPGTSEARPLADWTEDWSVTLVQINETLRTRFDLLNGWSFPMPVPLSRDPTLQADWQLEHDEEMTLDIWLSLLTADLS